MTGALLFSVFIILHDSGLIRVLDFIHVLLFLPLGSQEEGGHERTFCSLDFRVHTRRSALSEKGVKLLATSFG